MNFIQDYLKQVGVLVQELDRLPIEAAINLLLTIRRESGRVFFIGVGGSASNASHAVNDFRKICGMECYCPTDNISEITARINDEGWETTFSEWLKGSHLRRNDALFVLSVGGGNPEKNVSLNIVAALRFAKETGAKILGIVGRDGGMTKKMADVCVMVPVMDSALVTFHAESFQSIILHLIVAHPKMKKMLTKWEELQRENIY